MSFNSINNLIQMSPLCAAWVLWIVAAVFANGILCWKACLPRLVQDLLSYGKIKLGQHNVFLQLFRVPKRWFTHFYLWGAVWNSLLLIHFVTTCILQSSLVNATLNSCLETAVGRPLCSKSCQPDPCCQFEVFASLTLICFQVFRRLYECLFVSTFSPSASMHLLHYILGMYFYTALGPTSFLRIETDPEVSGMECGLLGLIKWYHIAGLALFLWSSWHQYRCHQILANLRSPQNSTVNQSNSLYSIPHGDWFEVVSSPHYLAEVLIYASLVLLTGGHSYGFFLVVTFTFLFLLISARQVHGWYLHKFECYPKRCIMLPWIW